MNAQVQPGYSEDPDSWEIFVLRHGRGSKKRDLAHVLGKTESDIESVRRQGPAGGRSTGPGNTGYSFSDLFALWHGREPGEGDWPKPAFLEQRGSYEWLGNEVALLATLVGQIGTKEIVQALTARLKQITGDETAERDGQAVQNQIARIGLVSSDVVGGIAASAAGREIGSAQIVYQAIRRGDLKPRRVGKHLVISYKEWSDFKSKTQTVPLGYVQLSTLREKLSVASDKLSEFARMGYVPEALRVNTFGVHSVHTTQFGTWYVPEAVAQQLLDDRRAGRPMPWHGKPLMDNLKVTWRLYDQRRHPATCETCQQIWGAAGAPFEFEDYVKRYHPLAHGAKRHLTMIWSPGLTVGEVAKQAKATTPHIDESHVRFAAASGALECRKEGEEIFISRTNATRWIARRCPNGDGEKSWLALETAQRLYMFTAEEMALHIAAKTLNTKIGTAGAQRGVMYVLRQQCAQLRERLGFSEEEAAQRAKVSLAEFRELLKGVDWRGAAQGRVPLITLQAVIKRIQSQQGYTVEEAAAALGKSADWVQARVDDGTVSVKRARWDRRLYITEPMLARLREAMHRPEREERLPPDWVRLSRAAAIAGVSTATVMRWADDCLVSRQREANGWHYYEVDLREQAREYWKAPRLKRAKRPDWLLAEMAATAAVDHARAAGNTAPPGHQLREREVALA